MTQDQNSFTAKELDWAVVCGNSVVIHRGEIAQETVASDKKYRGYFKSKLYKKYFLPFFSWSKKPHILITDEWAKNYYHWLFEALTKLIILKESHPQAKVILPSSYFKPPYILSSLKAFGVEKKDIVKIPKKSFLWVKKLAFMPHVNDDQNHDYYDFPRFPEIRQKLISYFCKDFKINFGARLYISRSNPKNKTLRAIANERELTAMLSKKGFKTIYMEDFSFLEQMSIMHHAKCVVATHGAGISNLVFMPEGGNLIEMLNENWLPKCFREMAARLKINYEAIACPQYAPEDVAQLANIVINVEELEKKLTKILD